MPALVSTKHTATITWLGYVPHRNDAAIETQPLDTMPLTWAGYARDCHSGETRPSCSRVTTQYARDTEIRNVRQLSIVSAQELVKIAQALDLDHIDPRWMGASIVLDGIPDFTHVPPASRIQAPDGATLTVDMLNMPCRFPARTIEDAHPGHGKAFVKAAEGRRGVTAWVERQGTLRLGDRVTLHVPAQRPWAIQ